MLAGGIPGRDFVRNLGAPLEGRTAALIVLTARLFSSEKLIISR